LVLDTADGRLARLQGTSSALGRWLDQVFDELADMVLHAAIAWAAFSRDGWPGWLLLGVLYASSKYLFQVQSLLGEELEREAERTSAAGASRERPMARTKWVAWVMRMIGHADVRWHLWIGLALFGRLELALVAYAFYFALRATSGVVRKAVRYA
jgi:phosphatidylglycerophosphate synthase